MSANYAEVIRAEAVADYEDDLVRKTQEWEVIAMSDILLFFPGQVKEYFCDE